MHSIALSSTKVGKRSRVVELRGGEAFVTKMMSLGIYPGRELTKLSAFALRGPVTVKVGRSVLALGHGVAAKIIVEPV